MYHLPLRLVSRPGATWGELPMNKAQRALASKLEEYSVADRRRKPEWQMRWPIEQDGTVDLTRPPRPRGW